MKNKKTVHVKNLFLGFLLLSSVSESFAATENDSLHLDDMNSESYGRVVSSDNLSTLLEHERDLIGQLKSESNQTQQVILYYMLAEVRRDLTAQMRLKNHERYAVNRTMESSSKIEKKSRFRQLASEWSEVRNKKENSEEITYFVLSQFTYATIFLVLFLLFFQQRTRKFRPFFEIK
ncbi:MAG: hypothetical protein QE271_02840 [Bacteriovoracaceae bacterium]|nr:hypothetical protein [Bacteriovoracaceae bacterium]